MKNKILFTLSLLMIIGLISCKEDKKLPDADRLFTPINLTASVNLELKNAINLSWGAVQSEGVEYTIVLTDIETLTKTEYKTKETKLTITDLDYDKGYTATVTGNKDGLSSKQVEFPSVTTEPRFVALLNVDTRTIEDYRVRLEWAAEYAEEVSSIEIVNNETKESVINYTITQEDKDNGNKTTIEGLPNTSTEYRAYIKTANGLTINSRIFKTSSLEPLPTSGEIIDLTTSDGDLCAALAQCEEGNTYTFVLSKDVDYYFNSNAYQLPSINMTFMCRSRYQRPKISLRQTTASSSSAMVLMPTNNKCVVTFKNVEFNGVSLAQDGSQNEPKTYIGYIFNQNTSTPVSLRKLEVNNCKVNYFAQGAFRFNSTGTTAECDSVVVNNCLIDSLGLSGSYYFVQSNNDNTVFKVMSATNNTFSNMSRGVFRTSGSSAVPEKVVISNNTFYKVVSSATEMTLLHTSSRAVNSITINNNLFTKNNNVAETGGLTAPSTTTELSNYHTSDFAFSAITVAPKASLSVLEYTADQIFEDVDTKNFLIKKSNGEFLIPSGVGSSRWR